MTEINIKGDIISDSLIPIYEGYEIPYTSPRNVIETLKEANGDIKIKINSGGGSVFSASEIYTELLNYKGGKKIVEIQGLAGSCASIIAMCGDEIFISPLGQIMIHNASCNSNGDKNDLEKQKDILKNIDDTIADIYAKKTNLDRNEILDMMNQETWLNPTKAKELGFVTDIIDSIPNINIGNSLYNTYQVLNKVNLEKMEVKNMNNIEILENQIKKEENKIQNNIKPIKKGLYLGKNESFENRISNEAKLMKNEITLGEVCKGLVTGKMSDTVKNSITTAGSSVLIPQILSSEVLDIARETSLFAGAGVPIIPMDSNNLTIARVKKDAEFSFKEEGQEAKQINMELDSITLNSKTIMGYCYVSLEAINSAKNLDTILKNSFAKAISNAIDKAFLYGDNQNPYAPSGIMNDNDILKIESQLVSYNDFIKAKGQIKKHNRTPNTYAITTTTEMELDMLSNAQGDYILEPKGLSDLKRVVSNQLKFDEETETSDALVFDSNSMLIGIQKDIQIRVIDNTDLCIKNGLVAFQVFAMLDCVVVDSKGICKIENVSIQREK